MIFYNDILLYVFMIIFLGKKLEDQLQSQLQMLYIFQDYVNQHLSMLHSCNRNIIDYFENINSIILNILIFYSCSTFFKILFIGCFYYCKLKYFLEYQLDSMKCWRGFVSLMVMLLILIRIHILHLLHKSIHIKKQNHYRSLHQIIFFQILQDHQSPIFPPTYTKLELIYYLVFSRKPSLQIVLVLVFLIKQVKGWVPYLKIFQRMVI